MLVKAKKITPDPMWLTWELTVSDSYRVTIDCCKRVDSVLNFEDQTVTFLRNRLTYLLPPLPSPGVVGGRVISARISGLKMISPSGAF